MAIPNWSEDPIRVRLSAEPDMGDELKTIIKMARDRGDFDVLLDFHVVDIVTSSSLAQLLKLRKLLTQSGHHLRLCNIRASVKRFLSTTGIDGVFEILDDKGCLFFEIDVPDDATNDEIKSVVVRLAEEADSLHRAMGGHGLKLEKLDIFRGVVVGSGARL